MRSRGLLLLTGAALLASSPAAAATLGEAPPRIVSADAECVQVPGAPGEVMGAVDVGGVRFLRASRTGFALGDQLDLHSCVAVATRASGAGVAFGRDGFQAQMAALRDPGGTWSPPVTIATTDEQWQIGSGEKVAVSDNGHAAAAWIERHALPGGEDPDEEQHYVYRLRVARRAPGGAFGPAETLVEQTGQELRYEVGIADNGDAVVLLWHTEGSLPPVRVPVQAAIAIAGGTFAAPVALGQIPGRAAPSLAVGADGRAVVAMPDSTSLRVAERPPGGAFSAAVPLAPASDPVGVHTRAAIGASGQAAILAFGSEWHRITLVSRAAAGPFSAPVIVSSGETPPRNFDRFYTSEWFYAYTSIGQFVGHGLPDLALTGDGRALVAARSFDRVGRWLGDSARLTIVPLGGATVQTHTAGRRIGFDDSVLALTLADGAPAIAWTARRTGRTAQVHLATVGLTPPADGPVPHVRIGGPRNPVIPAGRPMKLPVTCSGPCEVHAEVIGNETDGGVRLAHGGRGSIGLFASPNDPFAPRRLGAVRLRVTYGAPDARHPRTRTVTMRLRRTPSPPAARPVSLRAVRQGNRIRVTWRTDHAVNGDWAEVFYINGSSASGAWTVEAPEVRSVEGYAGNRSFAVTLNQHTADIRFVTLRTRHIQNAADDERTTVAVR